LIGIRGSFGILNRQSGSMTFKSATRFNFQKTVNWYSRPHIIQSTGLLHFHGYQVVVIQFGAAVKEYVAYNVDVSAGNRMEYLLSSFSTSVVLNIDIVGLVCAGIDGRPER